MELGILERKCNQNINNFVMIFFLKFLLYSYIVTPIMSQSICVIFLRGHR